MPCSPAHTPLICMNHIFKKKKKAKFSYSNQPQVWIGQLQSSFLGFCSESGWGRQNHSPRLVLALRKCWGSSSHSRQVKQGVKWLLGVSSTTCVKPPLSCKRENFTKQHASCAQLQAPSAFLLTLLQEGWTKPEVHSSGTCIHREHTVVMCLEAVPLRAGVWSPSQLLVICLSRFSPLPYLWTREEIFLVRENKV